ncbi:MAG: hypothetical protein ACRD9R_09850 [Pyrinomonadaceae bacterium]
MSVIKNTRHQCGGVLRLWELMCPYCHRSAAGWLHLAVIVAFAATAAFCLLKII